ncbi:hypothetical protein KR054_004840 [Drosophila jambulina]|nr:hypothetical protein KR054_004840 [Drosophila jambulina]
MLRHLLCLAVLLALCLGCVLAECNACSADTKAACVSRTQYQNCTDGIPTGPLHTCPNNTNCTASAELCTSNVALIACAECAKCNGTQRFTCTSPSTFVACVGVNVTSMEYSCTQGQVCNINNPIICGASLNGTGATCSYYDTPTETDSFCSLRASTGRYAYPNDSSCLRYIYCVRKSTGWTGNTWLCPSTKPYFNPTTLVCSKTKHYSCI